MTPGIPQAPTISRSTKTRATPEAKYKSGRSRRIFKNQVHAGRNTSTTVVHLYEDGSEQTDVKGDDDITDKDIERIAKRDELGNATWVRRSGGIFNKWLEPKADTPELEQEIRDLFERLKVKGVTKAAYILAKVYGYGAITIGLEGGDEDLSNAPGNPKGIAYLHAISKKIVKEMVRDLDPRSPTYGDIKTYILTIPDGEKTIDIEVDAGRMIHWVNPSIDGDPKGMSIYEPLYDKFLMKKNMDFAVGETLYRNARPWPTLEVPMDADDTEVDDAEATFQNINARSWFIIPPGYKFDVKATNNALNPQPYLDYMLTTLAAGAFGSKVAMLGTEAGAVTGSEINMHEYYSTIADEQSNFVEPILQELCQRCQDWGLLRDGRFWFEWNTLYEMDELETADVELKRAQAFQTYASGLSLAKAAGFDVIVQEGELVFQLAGQVVNMPGVNSLRVKKALEKKRILKVRPRGRSTQLGWANNVRAPYMDDLVRQQLVDKVQVQTADLENRMDQAMMKHLVIIRDEFFGKLKALWVKNIGPIGVDPTAPVQGAKADAGDLYGDLNDWETKDLAAFKGDLVKLLTEAYLAGNTSTLESLGIRTPTDKASFGKIDDATIAMIDAEGGRLAKQTYLDNNKAAMNEIADGIKAGQSYAQIADRVAAKFAEYNGGIPATVQKFIHTATSEARWKGMEDNGFDKGVFLTARDERVRPTHAAMDGQVVTREQAMPYLSEFGCRCVVSPMTVYDEFMALSQEQQQEMVDRYAR